MIKEAYDHPLHATRDLPRQSKPFRPHLKGRNNFLRLLLMYIVIWKKQIFLKKHLPLISPERFSFPPDGGTPSLPFPPTAGRRRYSRSSMRISHVKIVAFRRPAYIL